MLLMEFARTALFFIAVFSLFIGLMLQLTYGNSERQCW